MYRVTTVIYTEHEQGAHSLFNAIRARLGIAWTKGKRRSHIRLEEEQGDRWDELRYDEKE